MNSESLFTYINEIFNDLISGTMNLVPRLILALVVFFAGWLFARLVRMLIKKFILYLHGKVNEKLKAQLLKVDLQNSASFIASTIFWIILVLTIAVVTQMLGLSFLNELFRGLILYLPNILAAIVIVFIGMIAGRLVQDLITSAAERTGMSNGLLLGRLLRYTILLITVIIAIDQIGIDIVFLTNVLIIILGALLFGAALAFGLGAKISVSNILGAYYTQKIYKEGNTVRMGEIEGMIVKITPTAVILETKTGQVSIPAKKFNEEETTLLNKN